MLCQCKVYGWEGIQVFMSPPHPLTSQCPSLTLYLNVCLEVKEVHSLPIASIQSQHIPQLKNCWLGIESWYPSLLLKNAKYICQ